MTWEMKMQEYGDERASKAHAEGLAEGQAIGRAEMLIETLRTLVNSGKISVQDAVSQFGVSAEDLM